MPEVNISVSPNSLLYSGTTLNLTCTATLHFNTSTDDEFTVMWNGPRHITGERYIISQWNFSNGVNISSLTISPLTLQDEGMYTCTVTVGGESMNQCIIDASDKVLINVLGK